MTEFEIETVLGIIYEDAELTRYERDQESNFIRVFFTFPYKAYSQEYCIDLLPDEIYINDEFLPQDKNNQVYQYRQFMIAKGYSDYWKGNLYSTYNT